MVAQLTPTDGEQGKCGGRSREAAERRVLTFWLKELSESRVSLGITRVLEKDNTAQVL